MSMLQYLVDAQQNFAGVAAENGQIKASAGKLINLQALNVNAAARFLYLFDNTASSGTLIMAPIPLAIGGWTNIQFDVPKEFFVGLRFAASSGAAGTFTASGTADLIVTAAYL